MSALYCILTAGVKLYGFYLVLVSMFLTQDWHVMPEDQDFRFYQYQVFSSITLYFDDRGSEDIRHVILNIGEVLQLCVASW